MIRDPREQASWPTGVFGGHEARARAPPPFLRMYQPRSTVVRELGGNGLEKASAETGERVIALCGPTMVSSYSHKSRDPTRARSLVRRSLVSTRTGPAGLEGNSPTAKQSPRPISPPAGCGLEGKRG
jgi:hypothetical protein